MKKKHLMLLLFAFTFRVFADDAPIYAGADQATKTKLERISRLVAERKYDSAYQLVSKEDRNPFLLAKRVELATNYFAQSINHKIFAFKDLLPGETLDSVRTGKGTFNSYPFDPEVVIGSLLGSGAREPILYKALGDYWYDVGLRYQGRWTEDDEAVGRKVVENYQRAISAGLVTPTMLTNCADKATELGDYKTAASLYERALVLDPTLLSANFNIAYDNLMLGNYDIALAHGEKAIEKYSRHANYRMDAILLCADAAFYGKKHNLALEYLNKALGISREEYRVYRKLGNVYLGMSNIAKADESLDRLFAFAPTNPAAAQMVTEAYLAVGNKTALVDFFKRNLDKYAGLPEAQGNLYFHLGSQCEADGKKAEALGAARMAKDAFSKAKKYDGQIKAAVEAMIARNL